MADDADWFDDTWLDDTFGFDTALDDVADSGDWDEGGGGSEVDMGDWFEQE